MSSSSEDTQTAISAGKTFFLAPQHAPSGTILDQARRELTHWQGTLPEDASRLIDKVTQDLIASGIEHKGIQIGDQAPEFALPDANGQIVDSRNLLSKGSVVAVFYRGPWCPYCNLTLRAYQKVLPDIQALGGLLVAISPTLPDSSLLSQEKNGLEYPVLSDVGHTVSRKFGIVWQLPDELWQLYENVFGLYLSQFNGDSNHELPMPATFIIAQDNTIVYRCVNADYRLRAELSEILDALRDLKASRSN